MPDMMDEGKRLLEEEPSPAAQMPNWVDPVHEHEIVARRRQILLKDSPTVKPQNG